MATVVAVVAAAVMVAAGAVARKGSGGGGSGGGGDGGGKDGGGGGSGCDFVWITYKLERFQTAPSIIVIIYSKDNVYKWPYVIIIIRSVITNFPIIFQGNR